MLLALADANCCFTVVDIGAEGRRSDGGIFQNSELKHQLENNYFKLPKARLISKDGPVLPYIIVADEAFALTAYMLRPYPRSNLNIKTRVFNYRLSRARRIIECAFGILALRWRIYQRPIATNINNAVLIIQATTCLHNFLMKRDLNFPVEKRSYSVNNSDNTNSCQALRSIENLEKYVFHGSNVRDELAQYFYTHGAVKQQWTKIQTNDF